MPTPNYRVSLSFDGERKVFQARAPELEHCFGEGATRFDAISRLEEEIQAQVQNMLAHGSHPPVPIDEAPLSGTVELKLSQTLHRELLWQARQEGVEVGQLASEMLSGAIEGRKGTRQQRANGNRQPQGDAQPHDNIGNSAPGGGGRAPGNRGGFGPRYTPQLLDDRANFIEYVRGLEQTGGAPKNNNNNNDRGRRRRGGVSRGPGGGGINGGGGAAGGGGGNGPAGR